MTILVEFEKEYPLNNVFTKPEILDVRAIPKLRLHGSSNIMKSATIVKGKVGEIIKGKRILDEMEEELKSVASEEPEV